MYCVKRQAYKSNKWELGYDSYDKYVDNYSFPKNFEDKEEAERLVSFLNFGKFNEDDLAKLREIVNFLGIEL